MHFGAEKKPLITPKVKIHDRIFCSLTEKITFEQYEPYQTNSEVIMSDGNSYRDDVFSTSVRAGKRTYFFDVKSTRGNDLFMTITESKRTGSPDSGHMSFEKHKIFLYKEDFDKFIGGLQDAIDHIRQLQESGQYRSAESNRRPYNTEGIEQDGTENSGANISFEDLA